MLCSRLALARKIRGYSQTKLAKELLLTPRAISKYEKTGEGISRETLAKASEILSFPLEFLLGEEMEFPEPEAVSFRARSKMSAKLRNQAMAYSAFGLLFSDWMEAQFNLPALDLPDYADYDPEDAALALRQEWGQGELPIADVVSLLEFHGIRVFSIAETSQKIDAYSFWDEDRNAPFVFLSTSKSGERRRMDAAHELGHLVLHRKRDFVEKDSCEREREANAFASAFLMPEREFRSQCSRDVTLSWIMSVKKYWKTSAFAVAYRAHKLRLLSDWQYHSLCVDMSKRGMRTREPGGILPESSKVTREVIRLVRSDFQTPYEIEKATGIPYSIILALTFQTPIKVVKGRKGTNNQGSTQNCIQA